MNKERALEIAAEYGLGYEVQESHDIFVKDGMDESQAWIDALADWDLL